MNEMDVKERERAYTVEISQLAGKDIFWWLDIKEVMDLYWIGSADELVKALSGVKGFSSNPYVKHQYVRCNFCYLPATSYNYSTNKYSCEHHWDRSYEVTREITPLTDRFDEQNW